MSDPTSIAGLDLSPIPGKRYHNFEREFREEFIYFLLVDRFHDGRSRTPSQTSSSRSQGSGDANRLGDFCGGTLKGIRDHLDYIAGLGCTAIWLSPVFENNPHAYHGYAIQNYLAVDSNFGTKQDLIDLVDAAHSLEMRIILDVVINHSGDNWSYSPDVDFFYFQDQQFPFGDFRRPDRPVPTELRNQNFYHRMGQVRNFDDFPETQHGDFFSLKDFKNDIDEPDNADAAALVNTLILAHCYWLREADVDGFRVDAVKHLGPLAVARFSSEVREYAYSLGKRSFRLFGELIAGDDAINRYIGPSTPTRVGDKEVFFGLDSVLDFPLYFVLADVLKGFRPPADLINRYEAQRQRALSRGELGRFLVTFLDNHDNPGTPKDAPHMRFGAQSPDEQVVAGVGYLLCALGTPCIYYGTEQGFSGQGMGDRFIREAMFDLNDQQHDRLNQNCRIYQQIGEIAKVFRGQPALRFGRMYFREISGSGRDFGLPQAHPCTLAFSRILANDEVLVAYNTSTTEKRDDFVIVDNGLHKGGDTMRFLYGESGAVSVENHPDPNNPSRFVRLKLDPMQFVILR
ncbi:MAG: alpha-amylase family glycosyl hydrolase [Blastocatellia bacterium]